MREKSLGPLTMRVAAIAGVAVFAGACTWVKLTAAGEGVRMATSAEVARCRKLGATHTKTWTGIFKRSEEKMDSELETLARNEAADMGGNAIVPQGPASSEGRRSFDVFSCH